MPCGPHTLIGLSRVVHTAQKPTCPCRPTHQCGPHDQLGLAVWPTRATLKSPRGRALRRAMASSITWSCLAHGYPYNQPRAHVASTVAIFDFPRNSIFRISRTHLVAIWCKNYLEPSRTNQLHLDSIRKLSKKIYIYAHAEIRTQDL
ncbi:hypothetical protein J1N35_033557 [Gossypium stocksii]|uniref:Uncharacterized protein n=1 Tax=Gossypium stocksii TaxID=47602 RepID=A0A9D3ZPL1_9ROSI|nr:hypothetical protein J1N35_033557 [Gossypium stocksii]